jgi:hypothetical protein
MNAPIYEFYPTREAEVAVLFDLRIPGVAERLHRERAVWQEDAEIEALDQDHFVLMVRPGGARRLPA